jgi:hypothetical protein
MFTQCTGNFGVHLTAFDEGDVRVDFLLQQGQVFALFSFTTPFKVVSDKEHQVV